MRMVSDCVSTSSSPASWKKPANPPGMATGLANRLSRATRALASIATARMDYENFEDCWQPFLGGQGPVGAYFANLAPALNVRIKEAVRDAYCSGSRDGPRSLTASAWAVRGKAP
jgi:hypothetical protein